jgi:hypothetical protein
LPELPWLLPEMTVLRQNWQSPLEEDATLSL